jgi:dipeptidase D
MIRGFTTEDMASLLTEMSQKATAAGAFENQTGSPYSPWKYKKESPLRDDMVAVYTDMYGEAPLVTGIHGGLECASFAEKMPDCDLIAIGPTIENPHSPSERMSLSSFNRTCDYLAKVLEKL